MLRGFDAAPINFPDADDAAQQLQVTVRYSLGETGGAAGVENVGELVLGIDVDVRRRRWVLAYQPVEKENIALAADGAFRELIEDLTEDPLTDRQQVRYPRHDDFLDAGFGQDFLDVAEIGIGADDHFRARVIEQIGELVRRINRRNGNRHRADLLQPHIDHEPLRRVWQVQQNSVPGLDTRVARGCRKPVGEIPQARVGKGRAEKYQGGFAGIFLRALFKSREDR